MFVYEHDLFVLQQIFIHKVMISESIHELFDYVSNGERSRNSITNRITKLRKAGIIVQMKKPIANSIFYLYYYKIGKRGLRLLFHFDLLDKSLDFDRTYSAIRTVKIPNPHNSAMSMTANRSYLACLTNKKREVVEHTRGAAHEEFQGVKASIVPDWIFQNEETIICVECDTGKQTLNIIMQKYNQYLKKAKELNRIGKKLIVIFSVADGSVGHVYKEDRSRRVASIKEIIPPFLDWPQEPEGFYGVQFYGVSANRTPALVNRLLTDISSKPSLKRRRAAEDWFQEIQILLPYYGFDIVEVDKEKVLYSNRLNKEIDFDLAYQWRQQGSPSEEIHLVGVIFAEEGSIITYQTIGANLKRMQGIRQYASATLLVCYPEEESAIKDVYGYSMQNTTFRVTDTKNWIDADWTGKPLQVLAVTSTSKKEWRPLTLDL
nr:replication-relaxation family protein [Sporosarcina sp. P37]